MTHLWPTIKSWFRDLFWGGPSVADTYRLAERAGRARLERMKMFEPLPSRGAMLKICRPSGNLCSTSEWFKGQN